MAKKNPHISGKPEAPSSRRERQMSSKMEEQEKFEFIFRNTREAIVIIELAEGKAGRVLDANRAALELFESEAESIMQLILPEQREDEAAGESGGLFWQVMEEGYGRVERKVKTGRGGVRWLEITAHSFARTGESLVIAIIADVTERRLALQELEEARERAEEGDKLKSAFLANMSHEIRTPMNSIVGFSNLLLNPGLTGEERSMYVKRIVRNSELLLALISDIIDLAKIESGQLPIIYGKLKLSVLLGDMKQYALDEVKRLDKHEIQVFTEGEERECMIETDVIRLAQVMRNLINNAIKFTESGSVKIGCRRSGPDRKIVLFVQDTGMGIAPEHIDLVFDQFRQVDGSITRKYGGTGLGLAICRNLVRMIGGRIWVESREGEGSLFQVELPVKAARKV
jgi:PAS domain S-box-containing protein